MKIEPLSTDEPTTNAPCSHSSRHPKRTCRRGKPARERSSVGACSAEHTRNSVIGRPGNRRAHVVVLLEKLMKFANDQDPRQDDGGSTESPMHLGKTTGMVCD